MQNEHEIIKQVYAAKESMQKADELIYAYIPFIRSEASKFISKVCTDQDDEFSIAMIAFHEAIQGYSKDKGAFLKYASLVIRSRLSDYLRKEKRHQGQISIYEQRDEDDLPIYEQLADSRDDIAEVSDVEATKQEIEELAKVMEAFGVTFTDIAENSPKQQRTLEACRLAICYAAEHSELLDEMLVTKKLPLAELTKGTGVERKTLERHRKYVLAMLIIQTNGYYIVREHLRHVLRRKGGVPA